MPRLKHVAESENVSLTADGEKALIKLSGGDMRKVKNTYTQGRRIQADPGSSAQYSQILTYNKMQNVVLLKYSCSLKQKWFCRPCIY